MRPRQRWAGVGWTLHWSSHFKLGPLGRTLDIWSQHCVRPCKSAPALHGRGAAKSLNLGSDSWQCLLAKRSGAAGASEAGARTNPPFGAELRRSACRNPRDAERRFLLPDSLGQRRARPRTRLPTHRLLLRVTARREELRHCSCGLDLSALTLALSDRRRYSGGYPLEGRVGLT